MPAAKDSGKEKKQFVCSSCGAAQLRWSGKCPECGEWNTLVEELDRKSASTASKQMGLSSGVAPRTMAAIEFMQKHMEQILKKYQR